MAQDVLDTGRAAKSAGQEPTTHADANGEIPGDIAALRDAVAAWRAGPLAKSTAKVPPRAERFTTWSDLEVPDVRTPAEVRPDYLRDLGMPGAVLLAPGDPMGSLLFARMNLRGDGQMPQLATNRVDPWGTNLIGAWIQMLPGCP